MLKNNLFNLNELNLKNQVGLLSFLLMLIGVSIPSLSATENFTFWTRFVSIYSNFVFLFIFFMVIGINVIHIGTELSKNYMVVNRYGNYKEILKTNTKNIIILILYLNLLAFLLTSTGAVLTSFDGYSLINVKEYGINSLNYTIFIVLRMNIMSIIIGLFYYYLYLYIHKINSIYVILLFNVGFLFNITEKFKIGNLFVTHYNYLSLFKYESFVHEIVFTLIFVIINVIILYIIYNFVSKKKRDLI